MKNHLLTIILALALGYLGGISSLYLNGTPERDHSPENTVPVSDSDPSTSQNSIDSFQFELLKYKVEQLEQQLVEINSHNADLADESHGSSATVSNTPVNRLGSVEPNQQDLMDAGISSDIASNLLRRISQQNFRRLELQNLIHRAKGTEAMQYRNELRELNQNKTSLRSELGDDTYDRYLYTSGQNNRVQVSSVMAGSPAESSGLANHDIILAYDNKKILDWSDIRRATLNGDIGSYTNVDILRNGERLTLMVPRGTLGVELNPVQLDPDNL